MFWALIVTTGNNEWKAREGTTNGKHKRNHNGMEGRTTMGRGRWWRRLLGHRYAFLNSPFMFLLLTSLSIYLNCWQWTWLSTWYPPPLQETARRVLHGWGWQGDNNDGNEKKVNGEGTMGGHHHYPHLGPPHNPPCHQMGGGETMSEQPMGRKLRVMAGTGFVRGR